MEAVLKEVTGGDEEGVKSALKAFIDVNTANFQLKECAAVIEDFCILVLSQLKSGVWSPPTTALALNALRIVSRQQSASGRLTEEENMAVIVRLAGLNVMEEEVEELMRKKNEEEINVMVEAVKCLCNLVLNNKYLARTVTDLRALHALTARLALCSSPSTAKLLPHDVLFFDLRLIFLITACGPNERVKFRDEIGSLPVLVRALDATLFPSSPTDIQTSAKVAAGIPEISTEPPGQSSEAAAERSSSQPTAVSDDAQGCVAGEGMAEDEEGMAEEGMAEEGVAEEGMDEEGMDQEGVVKSKCVRTLSLFPVRDMCFVLPEAPTERQCAVASEILKIIFNQTVTWKENKILTDDELELFVSLSHLLRLLIISVPANVCKPYSDVFNHCCEVVMNIPLKCSQHFLIPAGHLVAPALKTIYPAYLDNQVLCCSELDKTSGEWNLAVAVILLNTLHQRTLADHQQIDKTSLTAVLGACSLLSRGCRNIRKFFKVEVLPPQREVRENPNQEDTLKGRLVRLMTAGLHDCMDVVAEFLFILCKENANRLVKHTGYGNAAGVLMNRGLLYGGQSEGQGDYSSDSETSENEEFPMNVDPVTGGPMRDRQNPFENMSNEEIEAEAEKLGDLIDQLNRDGIVRMMPVDRDNNPVNFPPFPHGNQNGDKSSSDES